MHIERLHEFVGQELHLLLLLDQLLLQKVDLTLQIGDAGSFFLRVDELSLVVLDALDKLLDIVTLGLVVNLALLEGRLLNFNFLIEESEFFVSLDELGSENVSFADNHLIVLLLLLLLGFGLADNVLKTSDIVLLSLDHVFGRLDLRSDLRDALRMLLVLFDEVREFGIFLLLGGVFHSNLLLKLIDLLDHDLVLHLEFSDLILRLHQVLSVQVTIRTHGFVQVLGRFQSRLRFNVFLLQFGNQVVLQLDLFKAHVVL